ncbi:YceI family protein [Ideonella sp. A 288]|uniref:YceI family protein n=1 Tax=Ideonella sp. A 288 TaxID=1962181 RepID=UPI000B4ADB10|nr:YceI family protein [Ideonella sp. A 288]
MPKGGHRLAAAACTIACGVCIGAAAQPRHYTLDPSHSFATFEVLHFEASTIRGRFGPLSGEVMLDPGARRGRVQVLIDTAAVSTGLPVFDARLREPDMLSTATHPQASFVAEGFSFDAQGAVTAVRGEFFLRGHGEALTLTARRFRCYTSPLFRREVCGGDFEATFPRSAFGITHSLPFVGDMVRLTVQVEAIHQPAER